MARTKPAFAERIKAMFAHPWAQRTVVRAVHDHDSFLVKIAWARSEREHSPLPPFPFHVYLIRGAESLEADETIPDKLLCYLRCQALCDPRWHLEVYTSVQDNVFACVYHHEKEKNFRKDDRESPYMPINYCFLVVDSENWEKEGLLSVEYAIDGASLPYAVNAARYTHWGSLAYHLRHQWIDQGTTFTEELLDEENAARGWPIDLDLYDEDGPKPELTELALFGKTTSETSIASPSSGKIDLSDTDVEGIIEEQREDSARAPYTALWHSSRRGPFFTFCLFLGGHDIMSSRDRLSVFARLNSGLLAKVSWTLHLYFGATMSSSFSIYSQEMKTRRHLNTSANMPPSYAGLPLQQFRNIYMYFKMQTPQRAGPTFVLSDRIYEHICLPQDEGFEDRPQQLELITLDLGSWDAAADMLHTYHTLCSQIQPIASSLSPTSPRISMRISVQPEYHSAPSVSSPVKLEVISHACDPITVNVCDTIFHTTHWTSCLRIMSAETANELPRSQSAREPYAGRAWGSRLRDYGFAKRVLCTGDEEGDEASPHLVTLHPGVPIRLPVQRPLPAAMLAEMDPDENNNDKEFLEEHAAKGEAHFNTTATYPPSLYRQYEGSWEAGRKYHIDLRDGTMIPRWTWGTEADLKGPFGLPALGVEMEVEGDREFVLIG